MMVEVFNVACVPLEMLLAYCYRFVGDYGLAIILFTLLTKIILFPVSLWVQRNSIKMVVLMPDLNRLKLKYYGDKDKIAEETQELYKKAGYRPFLSTVPMFIQLLLLIGVISAVQKLLGATESVLSAYPIKIWGGGTSIAICRRVLCTATWHCAEPAKPAPA